MLKDFDSFYVAAKTQRLPIFKFTFNKNEISQPVKNFLHELLYYIAVYIYQMNTVLPSLKELSREMVKNFDFLKNFYFFLKENEKKMHNIHFDTNDDHLAIIDILLKQYTKPRWKGIPRNLGFMKTDPTINFDIKLDESFDICIKILFLIICINENPYTKQDTGDVLFNIRHELYNHMIPSNFEDIDKNELGIISRIKWLGNNIATIKAAKEPSILDILYKQKKSQ